MPQRDKELIELRRTNERVGATFRASVHKAYYPTPARWRTPMALEATFSSVGLITKLSGSVHNLRFRIPKLVSHFVPFRRETAQPAFPSRALHKNARYVREIGPVLVDSSSDVLETANDSGQLVRVVALVGEASISSLKGAPWQEVMLHTAKRLKWIDEGFEMLVFTDNLRFSNGEEVEYLEKELQSTDILIAVAVTNQESVRWIQKHSGNIPNVISFSSSAGLMNKLGGSIVTNEGRGSVFGFAQLEKAKEEKELVGTITEAWQRQNSDDIRFCILVIINAYIRPVSVLKNLRAKGFSTLSCMVRNCSPQILNCLLDPDCRTALRCLNKCSPVDQVCNYRCIASYESPNLEAFSLCVLQKHNCLELDAAIPEKPLVPPMEAFRGNELCHEAAEDLFVGWLGQLDWSWRVVAGQNPAYDQFPCQYQLFYRGKAKGSFWYEPVFQVKTLDGRTVWRRRRYRVRRGKVPGTFYFSVLDNGVVSNEFWTIVDVADDLSWGLFHYHGAARVAGQSYTGAVLVSPDGQYPVQEDGSRLSMALDKCEIKEWELYTVDNCSCSDAPLGLPERSSLHCKIEVGDRKLSSV